MTVDEAVWVDSGRMSGAPCFRGSRLPVQQLFDWLADGVSLDEFVADFQIDRRAAETVLRAAGASISKQGRKQVTRATYVPISFSEVRVESRCSVFQCQIRHPYP